VAATDARVILKKGVANRVYFWLFNASTGAPITGATAPDSEVSKDGAAFADCTNEAVEVGQGLYYTELTATECSVDFLAFVFKTTSSGAQQVCLSLPTADHDIDDLAFPTVSGRSIDVAATGEVGLDYSNTTGGPPAANVTQIAGAAVNTAAAQLGVNVVQIGADATAVTNQKAFFNGTGYAAAASTVGTVTAVTNAVTVGTITDKTGYRLSATGLEDIRNLRFWYHGPAASATVNGITLTGVAPLTPTISWIGSIVKIDGFEPRVITNYSGRVITFDQPLPAAPPVGAQVFVI
jgi:hypothetical protein